MLIVLGSKSPRRHQLIQELGLPVSIRINEVEEIYPPELALADIPEFLAKLKAEALIASLKPDELLITSDTVVIHENELLEKPADEAEAIKMIQKLSNSAHEVISGVSMATTDKQISFSTKTKVYFSKLDKAEIEYYVKKFKNHWLEFILVF